MPSPLRPSRRRSIAVTLLAIAALVSLSCSGSDATAPVQLDEDGTFVRATITLLDAPPACGAACSPEFYSCDISTPIFLPRTWEVEADLISGGATVVSAFIPGSPGPPPVPPVNAAATLVVTGTDTVRNTAVAVEIRMTLDDTGNLASAVIQPIGVALRGTFANVEADCAEINTANDPTTLFALQPGPTVTITRVDTVGSDFAVAVRSGTSYTPDSIVEGTFSFEGQNLQRAGTLFTARVRVDGCFRIHLTNNEQGQHAGPPPATCN